MSLDETLNLALAAHQSGNLIEARALYHQVLAEHPNHPDALHLSGMIKFQTGDHQAALELIGRAITIRPDPIYLANLSGVFRALGRPDAAVAAAEQALKQNPNLPEAYNNLGSALRDRGQIEAAIASFERAVALRPTYAKADSNRVYALLYQPGLDPATIDRQTRLWATRHAAGPQFAFLPHDNDRSPVRRLRIGYLAPHFCKHVMSLSTLPLLRNHDHAAFEIICYSHTFRPDPVTDLFRSAADQWRDIAMLTDAEAAEQIRRDQIDILVDLNLHMSDNRLLIFARKPAPIQVSTLGYPGATGLPAIDYRLTDRYLDPPGENDGYYSERSIRLPDALHCFDPRATETDPLPEPNALPALTNGHITFGSLNQFCKVNDQVLKLWAQVLRAAPGSHFRLTAPKGESRQRVIAAFSSHGVSSDRIAFIESQPRPRFLAEYHRIDICLDTFPFNGHTTGFESAWMGVPFVTRIGPTPASRVGLCMLSHLDLPDLAARSDDEYLSIAAALAADLPRLQLLRRTLRPALEASPLTDASRYARSFEAAYRDTWRTWCASSPQS
jgi:protein O-GlcNAc transferase